MTELKLDETLQIEQSVAIKGSLTSITCMKDTTQPAIEIRSNDVLLGGFNFVGCNLNSTSGLIQVKGAENVTLTDMVFERNVNTNGPSCLLAINSTIEIQNTTAKNNRGVYGGAMSFVRGSEVVVVNSSFESNNATQQGGAIHMNNTNLDLSNSLFTENLALDDGGAIFAVGGVQNSILRITGSTFQGNSATSTGGALWFRGTFKCSIDKSIFKRNKANVAGGAIFGSKLSSVKLSATSFSDNSCGPDFFPSTVSQCSSVSVESVNKSADTKGGAVLLSDVLEIKIVESNFTKNQAQSGGAFFVNAFAPVTTNLEVSGTTFERNSAAANGLGGAMALLGDEIFAQLDNVTFLDNTAEGRGGSTGGGAIWGGQIRSIKISRSIFSRNKAVEQEKDDGEQEGSFWGALFFLQPYLKLQLKCPHSPETKQHRWVGQLRSWQRGSTDLIRISLDAHSMETQLFLIQGQHLEVL
ncbi:hypothetical protein BSKO_06850 [Bryopsis sp. KO-2023]|nr:hypothetical protein BSKO_06850 [Bryopsis sp. KO-2023]